MTQAIGSFHDVNRARAFSLPYPVSTNRYWRTFRGRQVVSTEAREFKAHAALVAKLAGVVVASGPVLVAINLAPKAPKRKSARPVRCIDLDNALKVALDALNGVAWLDDSQVVGISARRVEPTPGGGMEVSILEVV